MFNQDVQDASLEKNRKRKERPGAQTSKKRLVKEEYRMDAATDGAAQPDANGNHAVI